MNVLFFPDKSKAVILVHLIHNSFSRSHLRNLLVISLHDLDLGLKVN